MLPQTTKADTVKKVSDYIVNRVSDINKQDSAVLAGYSENTARVPSLIETTQTYKTMIEQVLTLNASTMLHLGNSLREDATNGVLDKLRPIEKGQLYKIITEVNDKLTPKVTLKESTDKNGNITRTAWAQNASQVQEVMTSEE